MATIFRSILFALLTFSILPAYATVVVYHNHHHYVDSRGHHHHQYCHVKKQWVPGHWVYRTRWHDRVWVPGRWVWVKWCR